MLFQKSFACDQIGDALIAGDRNQRWGVDSEYGRLTDVMLSAPRHLELVPCNSVSIETLRSGLTCCPDLAAEQHEALVGALQAEGVRCHLVTPAAGLADLSFMRDATLMTPWGLVGLRPALDHRLPEVRHVQAVAGDWGVPMLGTIEQGNIEGGDVCLLRPGVIAIGYSGERTNRTGAEALARLFESRGWRAILTGFEPELLHLDTHFTMVARNRAVACVERLTPSFRLELQALGIEIVPATVSEVRNLGSNLFSLGDGRVLSPADNHRINAGLARLGHRVITVEIDQFTRCGGGMHCLTMPLARVPA